MTRASGAADRAVSSVPPVAASAALQQALGDAGVTCTVEARDRLAVIVVAPDSVGAVVDDAVRDLMVRLAARHGFTHLALELPDTGAPSAGDAGAGDAGADLSRA